MFEETYSHPPSRQPLNRSRTQSSFDLPAPFLEETFSQHDDLPPYSLVMGQCQDGLPLVLDLTDPGSGSFLIAGDDGFGLTSLLHSLMAAVVLGNRPEEVAIHLISPYADDLLYFHHQPHFRISYEPFRPEIEIVLEEMVRLVVERQRAGSVPTLHLFAIDGLDLLWQALGPQSKLHLDWLIRHGPEAGLWVFATLESTYLPDYLAPTLDLFPARMLGQISQPNLARYFSGRSRSHLSDLTPGEEYFVLTSDYAMNVLRLPSRELEDTRLV
jgi:hypothetical protein